MIGTQTLIGRRHHGRKMSLRKFEFAQVEEGIRCELARGYLIVSEVPNYPHGLQVYAINRFLSHFNAIHPGIIRAVLGGSDCKLLIPEWESERHPDISVYLSAPKGKGRTVWRTWQPELVIEVVSEGSRDRDYTEKRDEYWTLGVKEYWIVDAQLEQVLQLRRGRSQWFEKTLGPKDHCETKLLPGFKLSCKAVFDAANDADDD